MRIVFRGAEADKHRVDLFNGAEALAALGRIGNLVSHYVTARTVRFRGPYEEGIQYVLAGTEPGSFSTVIQGISRFGEDVKAAARLSEAGKLISRVIRRGVGEGPDGDLVTENGTIPESDIDVLVEAAEPALKRMHGWIDQSAKTVSVEPDSGKPIQLNVRTKAYLEDEIVEERRETLDVSVAAINVNGRSGRVWFPTLGRTVPFRVPRDATARTLPNLSRYLVKYADRRRQRANYEINAHIIFKRVISTDGRVKRVLIYDCEPLDELL